LRSGHGAALRVLHCSGNTGRLSFKRGGTRRQYDYISNHKSLLKFES
jgi:hypothetical protein